ncbi:hypothetical protein ACLI09_06810 [Flavobacterium sp. RHBU_24]|uniref:hypothetical protein n=1 Tax=Flavobacterium sp. RHBU_24 TaxID=3391185 RepID=UPI0039847393
MKFTTLKKMLLAAAMLLCISLASAQDKSIDGAKAVTSYMKEKLSLNDSQYTKVYNVNLTFLQKVEENAQKNKGADKIKKLRALEDERDTKLKSVLSEDQYKNYVGNKAANRKKIAEYYQ